MTPVINKKLDNQERGKRILKEILRLERNLEAEREMFLNSNEYTLQQMFGLFADSITDRLGFDQIHQTLQKFGMIQPIDTELLIKRYDYDGDSYLTFWEFANIVLPCDGNLRGELLERSQKFEDISPYGIDLVKRFFNAVVNFEHIHKLRKETAFSGFQPREMFEELDQKR